MQDIKSPHSQKKPQTIKQYSLNLEQNRIMMQHYIGKTGPKGYATKLAQNRSCVSDSQIVLSYRHSPSRLWFPNLILNWPEYSHQEPQPKKLVHMRTQKIPVFPL